MFGSYIQGFVGLVIMLLAGPYFLFKGFDDEGFFFLLAFLCFFGGGYLKYLSNQTTRAGDDLTARGLGVTSAAFSKQFNGVKKLENSDYKLYLVEKFGIAKNETLGVFSFSGKSYETLENALAVAHELELKMPKPNNVDSVAAVADGWA